MIKKLLLIMKQLKITFTNLPRQYLMKTLVMNKFTMLMKQHRTGTIEHTNKAD
jgi:hypothetical protein